MAYVALDYPGGAEVVRRRAREQFYKNASLTSELEIKRAVARGRWYIRNELVGVIKLKKYRQLKRRYYD